MSTLNSGKDATSEAIVSGKLRERVVVLASGEQAHFRECRPEDAPLFFSFQAKIAAETTHTLQVAGRAPTEERLRQIWSDDLTSPLALRLGCFVDGKLVGQLGFHPEGGGSHPWTRHVASFGMMVVQEFWGKGIGRELLSLMEEHARSVGITRIEAKVRVTNRRGLSLYQACGYEIEGLRQGAARIDGQLHDEHFIAKILGDPLESWQPPRLQTNRLLLRPIEISDADSIFSYAKNPNVSRYTMWEPHRSIDDSIRYIREYVFGHYRDQEPEALGICLRQEPAQVVGTVGCFWISESARSMELAYALAEPLWGQGLVVEAADALVRWCRKEYDLVRLQARCKVENGASARVMQKLGMQHEGVLRSAVFHRGRHWDMSYWSRL
jgi:ribosomal-protein-alanine N-acetyltransferase